jgi:hypothetical protein
MPVNIQVTFDAIDPDKLAAFWAVALDYVLEPPPAGFDTWYEFAEKVGIPRERWHDLAAVIEPSRTKQRLLFQKVPEGKTVKNRVHLDLHVSAGVTDPDERWQRVLAYVDKVVPAGASVVKEYNVPGGRWMVMQDPEGNEFCLQ